MSQGSIPLTRDEVVETAFGGLRCLGEYRAGRSDLDELLDGLRQVAERLESTDPACVGRVQGGIDRLLKGEARQERIAAADALRADFRWILTDGLPAPE